MLRFFSRFIGLWLLAGALVAVVIDGAKSIAAGSLILTPLGQLWYSVSPNTINGAQAAIQRNISPFLWDPVIQSILVAPTFVVAGLLGLVLMLIGRKKQRS